MKCKSKIATNLLDAEHYGIPKSSVIAFNHILSLIIWTAYEDLANAVTMTYRQNAYLSFESMKMDHSTYAFFCKHLAESVQCYGNNTMNQRYYQSPSIKNAGSYKTFYRGLASQIAIPQIGLPFPAPTSWSQSDTRASIFSGYGDGIILVATTKYATSSRWMDVAWLSRYPEEEEFLFSGPDMLHIVSITTMDNLKKYENSLRPLALFEVMISQREAAKVIADTKLSSKMLFEFLSKPVTKYDEYFQCIINGTISLRETIVFNLILLSKHKKVCKCLLSQSWVKLSEEEKDPFEEEETFDILKPDWISLMYVFYYFIF